MRKTYWLFGLIFVVAGLALLKTMPAKAFTPNLLMDDGVFNNTASMTPAQIDSFLNTFPNSCISTNHGFTANDPVGYNPAQGFIYGGPVSAGHVLYDAALAYGLNPQVLVATLEKEEVLVSGNSGCATWQYASATGFSCTDAQHLHSYPADAALLTPIYYLNGNPVTSVASSCVGNFNGSPGPQYVGFSEQLIWASWHLERGLQRSEGNDNWMVIKPNWDNSDESNCYGGPMTQGLFKRCGSDANPVFFDGYTTIDGQSIHMDTGATASLYWYTPHFTGNQNFVTYFTNWFGGTVSASYYTCHNSTNVAAAGSGAHIVRRNTDGKGRADNLALVLMNNTGSACIEAHTWAGSTYQTWYQNTATNMPSVNPADDEVISADIDGSGRDELILVKLRNTQSGMIEVHTWDTSNQHWYSNIATSYPTVDPSQYRVISADLNGDGKHELVLVKYLGGTSGKVEIFPWSSNYQSFTAYIATNLPSISPDNYDIVGANTATDGGTNDKLVLVKYQGASGRIELHTWNPGEQSWYSNIATNYPGVDKTNYQVVSADINGHGKDQLLLVHYNFTGGTSSGKVEIFPWSPGYQSFTAYNATNLSVQNVSP